MQEYGVVAVRPHSVATVKGGAKFINQSVTGNAPNDSQSPSCITNFLLEGSVTS